MAMMQSEIEQKARNTSSEEDSLAQALEDIRKMEEKELLQRP